MKKVIAMVITTIMMLALGTTAFADKGPLTVEQAMQAALDFVGMNDYEVTFTKAHKDHDDGREVYELEFYANGTEYDVDVDVYSGRITDFSNEYHGIQTARGYGFRGNDWDDRWDLD